MMIVAKMYNANQETYKKYYKDAITRAYKEDNIIIDPEEIKVEIEELAGDTVQSQRSVKKHTRTISVYEEGNLKYIIGFSNTGFDEDKQKEVEEKGGKYVYGNKDWHSNTYLFQGINKIFEYYYDSKINYPDVKLYFYLLDTERSYANNLSNLMNYRKLATIGFDILNIDQVSFKEFEVLGFSTDESFQDLKYISFNKFANDISYLSRKNIGNVPSYLQCIDETFDIENQDYEEEGFRDLTHQKYLYTFKTLSAEGYDSFLTMWALITLAKNENKDLEFYFASEAYHLNEAKENYKYSTGFTDPIVRLMDKANLDIKYETSDEILHRSERVNSQYEKAKEKHILRNQELFKNNMRKKGILTKCYLCGCEVEGILEAAHLWGVSEISKASNEEINNAISKPFMKELIDETDKHHNENFYRRYIMANSGDNGVWLCSNHHGMFDSHYYCFDSADGKVLVDLKATEEVQNFISLITTNENLPEEILTARTRFFIEQRNKSYPIS